MEHYLSGERRNTRALCLVLVFALLLAGPAAAADPSLRFNDVRRVVAFADVHGAYDELVSVLRETAVIDESLHWRGGDTHLVSLGDLLDRGPDSRKVIDLLMRLELEARDAGGAVHVLLGNLAERLMTLNRQMLQETLGTYLHRRQIDALLKRRDRLVDEYGARAGVRQRVAP